MEGTGTMKRCRPVHLMMMRCQQADIPLGEPPLVDEVAHYIARNRTG